MKNHIVYVAVLVFSINILPAGFSAAQEAPALPDKQIADDTVKAGSNSALEPLKFITGIITRADGDRCPMTPTCSTYTRQAIQKHGLLKGWIMSSDRLMRCGRDELRLSDPVLIDGRRHSYDPVSNNDFWW